MVGPPSSSMRIPQYVGALLRKTHPSSSCRNDGCRDLAKRKVFAPFRKVYSEEECRQIRMREGSLLSGNMYEPINIIYSHIFVANIWKIWYFLLNSVLTHKPRCTPKQQKNDGENERTSWFK